MAKEPGANPAPNPTPNPDPSADPIAKTTEISRFAPKTRAARTPVDAHLGAAFYRAVRTEGKRTRIPGPTLSSTFPVPDGARFRAYLDIRAARSRARLNGTKLPPWPPYLNTPEQRRALIWGAWGVEVRRDFRTGTVNVTVGDIATVTGDGSGISYDETSDVRPKPRDVAIQVIRSDVSALISVYPGLRATWESDPLRASLGFGPDPDGE